jgi:hypothetical protein
MLNSLSFEYFDENIFIPSAYKGPSLFITKEKVQDYITTPKKEKFQELSLAIG